MHWRRKWQPTPVFLPGESQGRGSLVSCRLWGRTESDMTEVTQQQQHPSQRGFPGGSVDKELACSAGDPGLIPGLGRSPGEGNGDPLQYSCLKNPMDRGAWQAIVHEVTGVGHNLLTKPPPTTTITLVSRNTTEKRNPWSNLPPNTRPDILF